MDTDSSYRVKVVTIYLLCYRQFISDVARVAQVNLELEAEGLPVVSRFTVLELVKKFQSTGTIARRAEKRIRKSSKEEEVLNIVSNDPKMSLRKTAAVVGCSFQLVSHFFHKAKLFPYKPLEGQLLTPNHILGRFSFGVRMKEMIRIGMIDPMKIWFSDEKIFALTGRINKQNHRYWSTSKPDREVNPLLAHPESVHVWAALSSVGLIGPYFFTRNVNADAYQECIDSFFVPKLIEKGFQCSDFWFQQDGATPHCTNQSLQLIRSHFGDKIISRRSEIEWPANSPDLNPLDYFLWGYIDDLVRQSNPKTVAQLKSLITEKFNLVTNDMLVNTIGNFQKRIDACLAKKGEHFVFDLK